MFQVYFHAGEAGEIVAYFSATIRRSTPTGPRGNPISISGQAAFESTNDFQNNYIARKSRFLETVEIINKGIN